MAANKPHIGKLHSGGSTDATGDAVQQAANKVPSFFERVTNIASGTVGQLVNVIMFAPFIAPVAGAAANGISKLAKTRVGGALGMKRFENAGTSFSNALEKTVGEVLNGSKNGKRIAEVSQTAANFVGDGVEKAANALRIPDIAPKASQWNATRHLARLNKLVERPDSFPPEFRKHVTELAEIAESSVDLKKFSAAKETLLKAAGKNLEDGLLNKKQHRVVTKIVGSAEKALNSKNNVAIWKNLGGMFRGLPNAIKNMKVLPGITNVTFIGLSVFSLFNVAREYIKDRAAIKQMSKDIGANGDSNELIKEARSKLFKNSVVSGVTDTASLGLNVASAVKGNVGFLGFMAPQLVGGGINAFIGSSALPVYKALKEMHASGQKIPAEAYAELIGATSKDIKARGGASSPFAQELGKIYAAENATPAQVLRRSVSGEIMKDVNALIAANETAKTASEDNSGVSKTGSHVAALRKTGGEIQERKSIGDHTDRLVKNAQNAQHALAGV